MADSDPLTFFRPRWAQNLYRRARRFFNATTQPRQILSVGVVDATSNPDHPDLKHYVRTVRARPRPRTVPIGGDTFVFHRNQALATDSSLTTGLSVHPTE